MLVALTPACQAPAEETTIESPVAADVVSVRALSVAGGYRFEVGIRSPDLGCQQYADWWEVVSLEGELVYRRVLAHSHVAEQPFARRGVPVAVAADTVVWVRAHLHPTGYGGMAFKGSVEGGFRAEALPASFAVELAERGPRPPQCAN
ncbi:MAG: hypothetical protein O7A04_06485 [Acidobacteria bacterium]|nr:hypothetical protein [Acidobacteriota bacterium]